jgi:SAM-dependent methyltransferase
MQSAPVTRGFGLFEHFLSRRRAGMANILIGDHRPRQRILDIGCGSFPLFLERAPFREKFGMDQLVSDVQKEEWARRSIKLMQWDLDREPVLPFPDGYFDVVTMLAVFEHIEKSHLIATVAEIRRVLHLGGVYVMTTPAWWTDPILLILSRLRLVSQTEIDEHKETHTRKSIENILIQAGFSRKSVRIGSFECGMNLWATATKTV